MKNKIGKFLDSFINIPGGTDYSIILNYFYPEFIIACILYSLPHFVDFYFISSLSPELYTISGVVDNFLNIIFKVVEAFSIGVIVLIGKVNGEAKFEEAGSHFSTIFWILFCLGLFFSLLIVIFVPTILSCFHLSVSMAAAGYNFFRIRALSIFFMFLYFGCIGFLRAIKNTYLPMLFFGFGSFLFIIFDYLLIFGKFGIPKYGLEGSAYAYCIQYFIMFACAFGYIFFNKKQFCYKLNIFDFKKLNIKVFLSFFYTSIPIVIDKFIMAFAYVWLAYLISFLGTQFLSRFVLIKLLEKCVFLPAIALSQVTTLLTSNDYGQKSFYKINSNIYKIIYLAIFLVFGLILLFSFFSKQFISFINNDFEIINFVSNIFPALSLLVILDLLQLILSSALRGISDVKTVMYTRFGIIIFFFVPVSYALLKINTMNCTLKFFLIYASFFIGNGLMSLFYFKRLWHRNMSFYKSNIRAKNG